MTEPDLRVEHTATDELTTLRMFLSYLRESVIRRAQGLSEEEAHRPGVDSGTSLAWLLAHLADVESNWFGWFYAGTGEFHDETVAGGTAEQRTVPELVAAYRDAIARADAIIDTYPDLDRQGVESWEGLAVPPNLRWVLVHMIEETARHAGHADIIRERIDGVTG